MFPCIIRVDKSNWIVCLWVTTDEYNTNHSGDSTPSYSKYGMQNELCDTLFS